MAVYKRNQQFRLIGSSKFKDAGTRPLTLMVNHEDIDSILSNISKFIKTQYPFGIGNNKTYLIIFMKKTWFKKKRCSWRKNWYSQRKKVSARQNIWKWRSSGCLCSWYYGSPCFWLSQRILYFIKHLPQPWQRPKIKIYKCFYSYVGKRSFILNVTGNRYCFNIKREHKVRIFISLFIRIDLDFNKDV